MRITKVGVVGAGAMGAGIAALAASAGLPVVLLDIPGDDDPKHPDRSKPARDGLERVRKSKPAAFMDAKAAALITVGNTADHLELLADCSWICEADFPHTAYQWSVGSQHYAGLLLPGGLPG